MRGARRRLSSIYTKIMHEENLPVKKYTIRDTALLERLFETVKEVKDFDYDLEYVSNDFEITDLLIVGAQLGFDYNGYRVAIYIPMGHSEIVDYTYSKSTGELTKNYRPVEGQVDPAVFSKYMFEALSTEEFTITGANIKVDLEATLEYCKRYLGKLPYIKAAVVDTMMGSNLLHNEDDTLKGNVRREFGYPMVEFLDMCPDVKALPEVPIATVAKYAYDDVIYPSRLRDRWDSRIVGEWGQRKYKLWYELENEITPCIAHMEHTGICIDTDVLNDLNEEFGKKEAVLESSIYDTLGKEINLGSSAQLSTTLFDELGWWDADKLAHKLKKAKFNFKRGANGKWPAPKKVIEDLVYHGCCTPEGEKIAYSIIDLRKLSKLRSTYTGKLPLIVQKDGRIRCEFWQTGTVTLRFSSKNPNLQNIPKRSKDGARLRTAFIAPPGWKLVGADFSQLEMRILAHYTRDKILTRIFMENLDPHQTTADEMGIDRDTGKCVSPDTWLSTKNGPIRIGSIITATKEDQFLGPKKDIAVDTPTGMWGVRDTYCGGDKERFAVVTNKSVVICSANHRFRDESGALVRAEDLSKGLYLEQTSHPVLMAEKVSIQYSPKTLPQMEYTPTATTAYFAGLFTGDGSASTTYAVINLGSHLKKDNYGYPYSEWAGEIEGMLKEVGFDNVRKHGTQGSKNSTVYFGARPSIRFIRSLGLIKDGCSQKTLRVPQWVFDGGCEFAKSFIAGLVDSDGWSTKIGALQLCTKDPQLASDVVFLARCCGLDARPHISFNKTYQRNYYKVYFAGNSANEIFPYMRHKGKKTRQSSNKKRVENIRHRVVGVVPIGKGPVVDIEVGNTDHMYYASGCATHNTLNYGVVYGSGASNMSRTLRIPYNRAQQYIDAFYATYSTVRPMYDSWHAFAKKNKYIMTPLGGYTRSFKKELAEGFYINNAVSNTPIQGGAGFVVKVAMRNIMRRLIKEGLLNTKVNMLLQVHDELIFEAREDFAEEFLNSILIPEMENAITLRVPLKVDGAVGNNWLECH